MNANEAIGHITHALGGGELSAEISPTKVINQAGRFLVDSHAWNWLARPSVWLKLRDDISTTIGKWTAATNTLYVSTGTPFASYDVLSGDKVEVTSGTNATLGLYDVISKTSSTAIVLETDIYGSDLSGGDINAKLELSGVALPSDFGSIISLHSTNSLTNSVALTSIEHLNMLSMSNVDLSGWDHYAAVNWGQVNTSATSTGGGQAPTPRLEVWPTPTAEDIDAFTLSYRADWEEVTSGSNIIAIPDFCEAVFIGIVRAMALGYEEDTTASTDQRLAELLIGPMMLAAKTRDARVQPQYGVLRGGHVGGQAGGSFLRTSVAGPS